MTAGKGVIHSEFNASDIERAHLLQIWVLPERKELLPSYGEKNFPYTKKQNRWCLIASYDGRDDSLKIHQDIAFYATVLSANETLDYHFSFNRSLYVHVASGAISLNGKSLTAGDAAKLECTNVENSVTLSVKATEQAELLLFDLPKHKKSDAVA